MESKVNESLHLLCSVLSPFRKQEYFSETVNWDQLIALAHKHRVTSILSNLLVKQELKLPLKTAKQLGKQNRAANHKMLKLSAELLRLTKKFDQERIQSISLKGPVQSLQIFGDLTSKHSRDLDILIDKSKVDQCLELLKKMGYQTFSFFPSLNHRQKGYFLKNQNQLLFYHPERKVQLEIHWRLFANRSYLDYSFEELYESAEKVTVANTPVLGLGKIHRINFLLAHGAKHQWSLLYWLIEILYLLKSENISLEQLYSEVKKQRIHRPLLQFIGLSKQLFDLEVPKGIERKLDNPRVLRLVEHAKAAIQTDSEKLKEKGFVRYFKKVLYQMSLKKQFNYKLGSLNWVSVNDFQSLDLPKNLFFLYYPLRPFLWSKRYLFK